MINQALLAGAIAVLLVMGGLVAADRTSATSSTSVALTGQPAASGSPAPTPSPAAPERPTPQATPTSAPAETHPEPTLTVIPPTPSEPAPPAPTPSGTGSEPQPIMATPTPSVTPSPAPPPATAPSRTDLRPFATVGGIDLRHPATWVEVIGLHQSNHEGARDLTIYDTAANPIVMESRDRLSGPQSAADIVVDPTTPIVAPVSGVVARGGAYTLYCDFTDEFIVIVPDGQPGWEVKLLHLVDLQVSSGQRVEAGVTVLAVGARPLPFRSQVDDHTGEPSWPHTHLEVVDTSIPNQPNGGSGYEDCT